MTEQIRTHPKSFQVGKWFGPSVGTVQLTDDLLSAFLKMTDDLIKDEETQLHGKHLAGRIASERRIYKEDMIKYGVSDFMEGCLKTYAFESAKANGFIKEGVQMQASINSAWVVSQYENEYNPLHNHTGCDISGVLYLKMPNVKGRRQKFLPKVKEGKPDNDGNITFVYNSASQRHGDALENGVAEVEPKDGMMLLFPSYLLHTVYPFLGEEERRCIAFNGQYNLVKAIDEKAADYIAGTLNKPINSTFYNKKKEDMTDYE